MFVGLLALLVPRASLVAAAVCATLALALVIPSAFADPPGRVGRLSAVEGEASVETAEGETWPAELNLPVTSGFVLQTAPDARAEVRIGSIAVRMHGETRVQFARIDDTVVALALDRGTLALRLRARDTAVETFVQTPDGQVSFADIGRYRIDVDPASGTTIVHAERGVARIAASDFAIDVRSGRAVEIESGGARFVRPLVDAFDHWTLARDQREDAVLQGYVSPEMTGYEDLAGYGGWRTTASYGMVWVPHATPAGWSPYRYGRWQWIAPWGWTWIDAAPWGFAPFHYGRWCWLDGSWGWAPGAWVARPVYAPALVGWIGRPGWSVAYGGVATAGWVPLAPREPFVPWYRASSVHVQNINIAQVNSIQISKGRPPALPPTTAPPTAPGAMPGSEGIAAFANARVPNALAVAPAAALARGQRIGGNLVGASAAQLAAAPPLAPIAPPATARRWTGPRWGGVTQTAPPAAPLRNPVPPGVPLAPYGAGERHEPYTRPAPAAALPATPRFGNTPFGFAGSTPRVVPSPPVAAVPPRAVFAPPATPLAPHAALPTMRPYAPSAWPHAPHGGAFVGAPPRPPPGMPGAMPAPQPAFGGGFAPRGVAPGGFRAPGGGYHGAAGHR